MSIQIKNLCKKFHKVAVLHGIDLTINTGELVALLGPSGSGKTTLLRIIAGLEFADSGFLLLHGEEAHSKHAKDRDVGFVFQHYALFKHMTVFENVAFGLEVRPKQYRPTKAAIKSRVMELLQLIHLEAFYDSYPHQLSGGQRQRVALARALAVDPKVLLLDEPFGALDAKVRKELRRWMRRLHDEINVTSIFVTHDQEEAMEVADRVVIMNEGKIKQTGTPEEVWNSPADKFVYEFIGHCNEFDAWRGSNGQIHLINENYYGSEKIIKVYARPYEIAVTKDASSRDHIGVKVVHINPSGPMAKLDTSDNNGRIFNIEVPISTFIELSIQKGDMLFILPIHYVIF